VTRRSDRDLNRPGFRCRQAVERMFRQASGAIAHKLRSIAVAPIWKSKAEIPCAGRQIEPLNFINLNNMPAESPSGRRFASQSRPEKSNVALRLRGFGR